MPKTWCRGDSAGVLHQIPLHIRTLHVHIAWAYYFGWETIRCSNSRNHQKVYLCPYPFIHLYACGFLPNIASVYPMANMPPFSHAISQNILLSFVLVFMGTYHLVRLATELVCIDWISLSRILSSSFKFIACRIWYGLLMYCSSISSWTIGINWVAKAVVILGSFRTCWNSGWSVVLGHWSLEGVSHSTGPQ